MNLNQILNSYGFDARIPTKLVRHQSADFDLRRLFANDQIELYQSIQSKDVFSRCQQIISFIGDGGARSKFIGVYRVGGVQYTPDYCWPADYLYQDMGPGEYQYQLERITKFDDLIGRLVVDWGASTRSWHQWLKDKEVIEILPKGFVRPFPGYLDFVLDFRELCKITEHEQANREWHQKLNAVAGIYLIVDQTTGKQYVGSAYGAEGILGRWKFYAQSGHGGNNQLMKLLEADPAHARNFRFTVLRTLPTSLTSREVVAVEKLYKEKLGTRAFGLNSN